MNPKLLKLLNLALNNSNPAEASQALKMAAALLQKEGLNPKDYIQKTGSNTHSELIEAQRKIEEWRKKYVVLESQQISNITLKSELREAKMLAVKWHKNYQTQVDALAAATKAQRQASKSVKTLRRRNKRLKISLFSLAIVCLIIFHYGRRKASAPVSPHKQNAALGHEATPVRAPAVITAVRRQKIAYQPQVARMIRSSLNLAKNAEACTVKVKIYPSGTIADAVPLSGSPFSCHDVVSQIWKIKMPTPPIEQQRDIERNGVIISIH